MSDIKTGSIGRNDTWRDILTECMTAHGEDISLIVGATISTDQLDSIPKNTPDPIQNAFLVWTHRRIYFPAHADG